MSLREKSFFMFDMDGVLFSGLGEWDAMILGGYKTIATLKKHRKKFAFVGSGSHWSTNETWCVLRSLGFMIEREQIWLAAKVAARHLLKEFGRAKCLVVGEEGLFKELKEHGHEIVHDWRRADAVVVGHDRFLSYEKLTKALRAINNNGAYFMAVNKVRWYYSPFQGPYLSPGAVVAALEHQSGREAVVAGKPSLIHYKTVLEEFDAEAEASVMVGDNPEADLKPAKSLGATTVLVKSVKTWEKKAYNDIQVDIVVSNVDDLVSYL